MAILLPQTVPGRGRLRGEIVNKVTASTSLQRPEVKDEDINTVEVEAPTTMNITITKVWDDSVSTANDRSAKIVLYANDVPVQSYEPWAQAGTPTKEMHMSGRTFRFRRTEKDIDYP